MKKILLTIALSFWLSIPSLADTNTDNVSTLIEQALNNNLVSQTTLNKLQVNNNATKNDNSKIVLVYLTWNVKNPAAQTREMIQMYSARLVNEISKEKSVAEVVIFWEVPYHAKGSNVAKFNYSKRNNDFYVDNEWFAPVIR